MSIYQYQILIDTRFAILVDAICFGFRISNIYVSKNIIPG